MNFQFSIKVTKQLLRHKYSQERVYYSCDLNVMFIQIRNREAEKKYDYRNRLMENVHL